MPIPKIVHYVWVGPKPLPDEDQRRVDRWRVLLPDWEFRFWHNDNVDFSSSYLSQAFAARAWNRVSDYVRMDSLARFGGVYLDADVDVIKPLDPLLQNAAFLGFQSDGKLTADLVNGAIFGAETGHWLPSLLRDEFNTVYDGRADRGAFSGPGLLTKTLKEHGLTSYSDEVTRVKDVTIYPMRYFYPYSWVETYSPSVIGPDTFAVHRWAESWVVKKPDLRTRIRRAIIKRMARHAPSLALFTAKAAARRGSRAMITS